MPFVVANASVGLLAFSSSQHQDDNMNSDIVVDTSHHYRSVPLLNIFASIIEKISSAGGLYRLGSVIKKPSSSKK
jgi:hypothetical protein